MIEDVLIDHLVALRVDGLLKLLAIMDIANTSLASAATVVVIIFDFAGRHVRDGNRRLVRVDRGDDIEA